MHRGLLFLQSCIKMSPSWVLFWSPVLYLFSTKPVWHWASWAGPAGGVTTSWREEVFEVVPGRWNQIC